MKNIADETRRKERETMRRDVRAGAWVALLAMAAIGGAAGDAVSAERAVLVEYFNATW